MDRGQAPKALKDVETGLYPNILRFYRNLAQPIVLSPCHGLGSHLAFPAILHVPAFPGIDRL
jgi:hypothetical protein